MLFRSELERGGFVRIRQWTGADQQEIFALQQEMDEQKQPVRFMCHVIARSLVDDKGQHLLEGTEDEVNALTNWSGADLMKVGQACLEINGMTAAAQAVIEKN